MESGPVATCGITAASKSGTTCATRRPTWAQPSRPTPLVVLRTRRALLWRRCAFICPGHDCTAAVLPHGEPTRFPVVTAHSWMMGTVAHLTALLAHPPGPSKPCFARFYPLPASLAVLRPSSPTLLSASASVSSSSRTVRLFNKQSLTALWLPSSLPACLCRNTFLVAGGSSPLWNQSSHSHSHSHPRLLRRRCRSRTSADTP